MDEYIRKQDAIELCNNPLSEQSMRLVPPADVVPVVRCRSCLHFDSDSHFCFLIKGYMQYDDFCSYGKTR